jgi:UDP-hydrolysing UDP-N-acetyl-D-glucosamine 2-epimerase
MHLSPIFGRTVTEIERDGFAIAARVELPLDGDRPQDIARATGAGLAGMADAFAQMKPDVAVVFGDRFEMLAAAAAALFANIPIAHVHGGEVSEGAVDDAIRHAITKMARLHFVAAEPYGRRVAQMGECPEVIHMVGALGLDHIAKLSPMTRDEIAADIGFSMEGGPVLVITYHPETATPDPAAGIGAVLEAFAGFPAARLIFTGVNADVGHGSIARKIQEFVKANASRATAVTSLGQRRYLSLLKIADVVVGNSSSGLIEAPALGIPTVNIGSRQDGRLKARSVIDCPAEAGAISAAITRALDPAFRKGFDRTLSLYGQGDVSRRIKEILKAAPLVGLPPKRFRDLL